MNVDQILAADGFVDYDPSVPPVTDVPSKQDIFQMLHDNGPIQTLKQMVFY